jgi:3-oxoacyl-[acyl-carrier protein] reductase
MSKPHPIPAGSLRGHIALVTGANCGIGAATALALAQGGARVLLSYLCMNDAEDPGIPATYRENRASTADDTVEAIRADGGTAIALEADLAEADATAQLFELAESELGPVDILVNNASGWLANSFVARDRDDLGRALGVVTAASHDTQFAVDARGSALMIAEFARRLLERGGSWGRIIGLTSGGPLGFPGEVSYGAAKAALENYTMSAAFELAPYGVTANIVYPPVTDTGWVTDAVRDHVKQRPDLVHIVEPADVAETIAYLCTDGGRFITANKIHLR